MATTKWYTISELSGFNSQNGYVGETSWFWGRYSKGARSGYIGVGNVNGSSRSAVLVFWLPFPSSLISSNITIDKIEVQMNQTVSSGISSGKNYATYACTTAVQPDTPKAWNGSGQTNDPKIFATDNSITTKTSGTTWNPTYTYKVTNRSNLPAGTKGCYIQFSGGNYQVQSMSEFTMGPNTYPRFKFTYTDSSSTPTNYTITYNPNGAPGSSVSVSVASGSKYTLRSCPWTRSGYTFKGWSASPTGTTPASSPQTCTGNKTWYAIWQSDASSKTIFFYPISTSGLVGDYPGQKIASSKDSYFKFPTMSDLKWTRSGFTLQYWNTNRQLSGTNYYPGSSYQIAYSDLQDSYYAVWQPSTPNNVTFTFDPGSYSDGSKVSYTRSYAYSTREVSLPDGDNYFTGRSDSGSQKNFYLTCDCGAGSFSNGVSVAQVSNDWTRLQTQYVQTAWQLDDTVTSKDPLNSYMPNQNVTFYPYWGSTSNTWQYDVVLKIPNEQPTRSGYSFVEWNTSSSGRGTSYQPGGSIHQLKTDGSFSNKTLYAIWETNQVYINYYIDNDTAQPTNTVVQGPYDVGDTVKLSDGSGWISSKWGSSVTFYTNYNFQGGSFSNGVTPNSTYSVSRTGKYDWVISGWLRGSQHYELSEQIRLNSNISLYPYWADSSSIVSHAKFTPITPIRKGYKFLNWNTQANGNGTAYYANTNYDTSDIDKDLTLYAIWEPEWTIKINNGTSWGDYHVWIYTGVTSNNGWQQAIPYVYDGSNWKLTKI